MEHSILDLIGNTPLVKIRRLNTNSNVTIYAKLEYFNPGGSTKDRAALSMIEAGEASGELTRDKTVMEATSGNTGIGLALICAVKGYRLLLAMSEAVSVERQKILQARGADILLTPGHLGTDGAIEEVYRLARENPGRYFMTDQFNNPANWQAHYNGTAVEIWQQTGGKVNTVVATLGTSGTLMGISRRMQSYNTGVRIVGVEPYLGHKIQGLKNMKEAYCPEIFDKKRLDKKINIDDEDAFEMTRRLAREEGLLVGMSSGAAMAVAVKEAAQMEAGILVVILPDGGERYLSTPLFTVREKVELTLFNTLSRSKQPFVPLVPGRVSMYTCGPTAHARMHIGGMRRFVFSDMLSRYLAYRGYTVEHLINVNDLDDKTLEGSEKAGTDLKEFTDPIIDAFKNDCDRLGILPADHYPTTSDNLDDMVALADKLVRKGYAYEKLRSLYFDISRLQSYGRLSGIDLNKIKLGATVDLDEYEKDNPRDFTLFKRSRLSELKRGLYTKTEWGNVRPSWNIQCAAISNKYLGESYDIHAGASELIFPHHENELAIAVAVHDREPVRFWLNCDRVLVDGKKLDRSDAALTLAGICDLGFSEVEIRYWLLLGHYRKPLEFSVDRLREARRSLRRLNCFIQRLFAVREGDVYGELDQLLYDIKNGFNTAMDDDLNTSAAMASIFNVIRKINTLINQKRIDQNGALKIIDAFRKLNTVFNIFEFDNLAADPKVGKLLQKRQQARSRGDWELADALRDQLQKQGIIVRDEKVE